MTDADERAALQALVGSTLQGRYRIDALLGMGGMGGVFRARHLGLAHDVAIKVLRSGMRSGHIAPARFEREARSASRLDHPNCVRVTDFGELEDGAKFLVMELLAGDELRSRLGAPWNPADAIDVGLQILDGLEHAHARGVVHRDLKPENVLLDVDHRGKQRVKLVDFGIAKLLEGEDESEPKLTRTGMMFGTPRYMSPEQAGGGKVDARTDLYAVGLLLYEMLAGRPPFEAEDVGAIMRMHVLTPPPDLPASVPPALVAVVMRLLAKSRADRFASATDTMAALERARTQPTTPPIAPPTTPTHELPLRDVSSRQLSSRQLLAAGALLAVAVVGVIALALRGASTPTPTSDAAPIAAPREPMVARPAEPPASRPMARGVDVCRGDECECEDEDECNLQCGDGCKMECKDALGCRLQCGEDCKVECEGRSECTIDVGDDAKVECKGSSRCNVNCRGACTVGCKGNTRCELSCADGDVPLDCGKDKRACGRCR